MRVRKMDANGDYVFGHGQADFWVNVPDGVAQSVVTRLHLEIGEWFLDTTEGAAWKTEVLGKYTGSTRDPMLRTRILGTPGLKGIASYSSTLNRDTRGFAVNVTVDTQYGQTTISEPL